MRLFIFEYAKYFIDIFTDLAERDLLSKGKAYGHATEKFMSCLRGQPSLRSQVIGVYSDSLKFVWQVAIAISGFGSCFVILEREVKMRTELDTKYGLMEKNSDLLPHERSEYLLSLAK